MSTPFYETFQEPLRSGIRVAYLTLAGGYNPLHWHDELEILYHLNGNSDITIEGKTYPPAQQAHDGHRLPPGTQHL